MDLGRPDFQFCLGRRAAKPEFLTSPALIVHPGIPKGMNPLQRLTKDRTFFIKNALLGRKARQTGHNGRVEKSWKEVRPDRKKIRQVSKEMSVNSL